MSSMADDKPLVGLTRGAEAASSDRLAGERASGHDVCVDDVIYLVHCALNGVVPQQDRLADMDLGMVLKASRRHQLSSACAMALESAGVHDVRFVQELGKAVRKIALMDADRAELLRRMDEQGIWYVPLKGCVLKDLWPAYGMRQMADNDILFDESRANDTRAIMESMGYRTDHFDRGNHDVYFKDPVYNFELHRFLFTQTFDPTIYSYYRDIDRLLVSDGDGTCGRHMRDEDFYVYFLAHEYKHVKAGGIGLRALADTYVWLRAKSDVMDWDYVAEQLDALGITELERQNRQLALALFTGEELTQEDEALFEYMVESGAYGTLAHSVSNQIAQYGRGGYFLRQAFPSIERMAPNYPILKRVPVLYPVCWALRLANALATKPRKVFYQLRATLPFGSGAED